MAKVISLKVAPEKHEAWKERAQANGQSFNAWAIATLDSQLSLEESLDKFQEDKKKKRERELKAVYPQGQSKCKHVAVGHFCYQCGEKRWV